jgi:hypothetical protein
MRLVHCPSCDAIYHVVKANAGPETVDQRITCRVCDGPFPFREKNLILKYFLLRERTRRKNNAEQIMTGPLVSKTGQIASVSCQPWRKGACYGDLSANTNLIA